MCSLVHDMLCLWINIGILQWFRLHGFTLTCHLYICHIFNACWLGLHKFLSYLI